LCGRDEVTQDDETVSVECGFEIGCLGLIHG